jgi:magnesium-transporting ATPase (P-type)
VIAVGGDTKIMKNMKKAPTKVSNMMKLMNLMLYSVFGLQIMVILLYSILGVQWDSANPFVYLEKSTTKGGAVAFIERFLAFWVNYS